MVAAQVHGIDRYIMLSSINADTSSTSKIAHYHRAKANADNYLRESDLNYTIVCPGALTDEKGTGRISLSSNLMPQGDSSTSRENLAGVLVACLDVEATFRKSFSLTEGDSRIAAALHAHQN